MPSNVELLRGLFKALNAHDHDAMANCYHEDARFRDIAFNLNGRKRIHAMWHLVCNTDIQATVGELSADEAIGRAVVVDVYTFSDTGRLVRNPINSGFQFRNGLIVEHNDECDPLNWARQAYGGIKGELIGRIGLLRRIGATRKIKQMLADYPQYR
jgi:ketosteroid isomerase-like protein